MSEIIFIIESSDEGGYTAKALGYSMKLPFKVDKDKLIKGLF